MKYDICGVARAYVRAFYRFVSVRPGTGYNEDRHKLLMYGIRNVCGLECCDHSDVIRMYGESCIRCLSEVGGVPKNIKALPLEDRVCIVNLCDAYSVFNDIALSSMEGE